MKTAYILTQNSLTVTLDGKVHAINSSHPGWKAAIAALKKKDDEALKEALDTKKAFTNYTGGKVEVKNGVLYFDNSPIHSVLADRIVSFMQNGLPHDALVAFLGRLLANPSRRAVQELYTFLEHKHLPITDKGTFLAYKSVRSDWTDHHTGSFDNHVGNTLSMRRNQVDDNADHHCSYGFHAGSLSYASSFGGSDSRLLIVEIDPADVVSVPKDCDCQKLRTCKYVVVNEFTGPLPTDYLRSSETEDSETDDLDNEDHSLDSGWKEWPEDETYVVTITVNDDKSTKFARDHKGRFVKQQK